MFYTGHGGACCGISHVSDIGSSPTTANTYKRFSGPSRACLERVITSHGRNASRVLEVVTAQDVDGDGTGTNQTENWEETLVELGFQKVSSFVNSNSGNVCTVWHKHPELTLHGEERQPGRVEQVERVVERVVEVPAREEVRPIMVEYCPNFHATGRGRMFSGIQEVREAHPLIRRIDRRTIMSNGAIVWADDV